jgi:putative nucleotidyltransferase with HDIG domain
MKTQHFLQSLSQKYRQWQRYYKVLSCKGKLLCLLVITKQRSCKHKLYLKILQQIFVRIALTSSKIELKSGISKLKSITNRCQKNHLIPFSLIRWLKKQSSSAILVLALLSFTGVIGHKLYNQPELRVGTLAPQTFKAPHTASIEDQRQTETQIKSIRQNSFPILEIDNQANAQINEHLQQLLNDGNEIRSNLGPFPFFDTAVLSIATQQYLRSCPVVEWQKLLISLQKSKKQNLKPRLTKLGSLSPSTSKQNLTANNPHKYADPKHIGRTNINFSQALGELGVYRTATSEQNLASLLTQIVQARKKYAQALGKISSLVTEELDTIYTETAFLELSDDNWIKAEIGIRQSAERILAQGIPYGLPSNILHNAVSLQLQNSVPDASINLANKLLLTVLQPNLKVDLIQTNLNLQRASAGVSPVMVEVHSGNVIVKKGELITAWQFDVLDYYHLIHRQVNWLGLIALMGIISIGIRVFIWVEYKSKSRLRRRDRLLIFLLALSTPTLLAMGIPYTNWSGLGLLLGSLYSPILGITVISLLTLVIPLTMEVGKIEIIAGVMGGILSCYIAQRLRSREELALLGITIAITQGGIYLLLKLLSGAAFATIWYLTFKSAALFALSGLVWSIVALGLSPYLEKLFDLTTPIRLAELANPNRPLLKRLAQETPGTFQHTLFVATLAEAAAKKLGCNVELVRAGTLYHDIGKMHDPLGFIENQMGGPNKHDTEIKDPWKSAEIIKKHVIEGLVMAKKHSLPTAIQAFIPEHQGTMAITYFYHQAKQMAQENPQIIVDEADFRYSGPIPQSRETGIVMLADSCEAALRSVKDVTTEQALSMLNNILRAKWEDNQMVDSGITREEMSHIAHIFTEVWQQFHHKRIAYPKLKTGNSN